MTPLLRSKMGELEMKMKKHMMEQKCETKMRFMRSLFHRPSPKQLRQSHPGVYASLSEDAKRSMLEKEGTAMVKVYVSFIESTLEQMLVSGKISAEQYNRLYSAVNEEGGAVRKELLEAVDSPWLMGMCDVVPPVLQGEDPVDYCRHLGSRMAHLHLVDCDGVTETHLIPGDGVLNLKQIVSDFRQAGYDGRATLELVTHYMDDPTGAAGLALQRAKELLL